MWLRITPIFCLGLLIVAVWLQIHLRIREGFVYKGNPCGAWRDCRSCAAGAGCGWCADLKQCWPMAQDGFPMRVEQGMGQSNVPDWVKDFTRQVPVCGPYRFVQEPERC